MTDDRRVRRPSAATERDASMASGAQRRKRKRESEKREAWVRFDAAGGDLSAYERSLEEDATAKKARAAAARRAADVEALNDATGSREADERGQDRERASSSLLRDAVGVRVRVRKDSAHALRVLCRATSDGDCFFACGQPRSWGRRGIEAVVNALGFGVLEYDEITLSKAPELAACVIRLDADDENASVKRKKKRAGGVGSAVETFLARAEKLVEPIQAPDVSGDEIDRDGGGLNAWVAAHRRKRPGSAQAVTASIDAWFEKKEAEEAAAEEAANAVKSDDGWTKVEAKRGRRKTTEESTGTTIGSIRAATADRRRKEPKKIAGEQFYRFQSKEKKRNEIIELQAKFEQDKQRIARLKAARKFRPM